LLETIHQRHELHHAGALFTFRSTMGRLCSTLGNVLLFRRDVAQAHFPGWAVLRMHLPTLDLTTLQATATVSTETPRIGAASANVYQRVPTVLTLGAALRRCVLGTRVGDAEGARER
jgi:hypothetical protein